MYIFVVTFHVVLSTLLVLIILMQPGKGGDVSSAFGGGSSSQLFGSAGPGNFLTRGTGLIATLFMVTSIALALYSTDEARGGPGADDLQKAAEEGEQGEGFLPAPTDAPAPSEAPLPTALPETPTPAPAAPTAPPVPSDTPAPAPPVH